MGVPKKRPNAEPVILESRIDRLMALNEIKKGIQVGRSFVPSIFGALVVAHSDG